MRDRFPLTYDECRARFRHECRRAGARLDRHPISAGGPDGQELTIDVATWGAARPRRALLVMSGTHGIEGFAGSEIQVDAARRGPRTGDGDAIVFVHAVNPWGMAHWRRQNERNVDLNRNWQDFTADLPVNDAYGDFHDLLCPDASDLPGSDVFLAALADRVDRLGVDAVRRAISGGQYTHADGLYFGGGATEESTDLLGSIADDRLAGAEELTVVDLHTGHGWYGTYTLLSPAPFGTEEDLWIRRSFDPDRVETTADNPAATSAPKRGQLAPGIVARIGPRAGRTMTFELGTRSETRIIAAERAEHWIHRFGGGHDQRAEIRWEHRICSIPDAADWEESARAHGSLVLDQAARATFR